MFGIVYNPVSGDGKGKRLAESVRSILEARGETVRMYESLGVGQPAVLAEQAANEGCTSLVCLGGDGTLSEIVGAVVAHALILYIVPTGTGNDFARFLGLPKDPMEAFQAQLDGTLQLYDCGKINDKVFINISGSGFDVDVLVKTEEFKAIYPGEKAYTKALLAVIRNYQPFSYSLSLDGAPFEERKSTIIEVANGQYFGGGMRVAPGADAQDGFFDVIIVRNVPKVLMPILLPLFVFGLHVRVGIAKRIRAKQVKIRAKNMTVNIDGRLEKMDEAEFVILPGKLRLHLPSK